MSRIRPLERADLAAVADLYELVQRSHAAIAPPGLAGYFERLTFDHPLADPEVPALVYEAPEGGIVGFIGSHVRRFAFDGRDVRIACSGQLVAHPEFRSRGVGALLMRSYLAGPQDVTITDGATDEVREIWERLGGVTNAIASTAWVRPLAPAGWATAELSARRGWDGGHAARVWAVVDAVAGRPLRPAAAPPVSEPATAAAIVEQIAGLARQFRLRPAYDERSLAWVLEEAAAVTVRGPLAQRIVRGADGQVVGWYVAYLPPGESGQVLQAVGIGDGTATVLEALAHHAAAERVVAVEGRVDPFLAPHLRGRRCLLRPSGWALVHTRDDAVLAAILSGRALLTRLDGEWWMGHHLLASDQFARTPSGGRAAP